MLKIYFYGYHLIFAHEVTDDGIDRDQLTPMARLAREATGQEALTVVADRGYFKGWQIKQCVDAGIIPMVAKTMTSNNLAKGLFDKQDFIYIAQDDQFCCPAGQRLIWRHKTVDNAQTINKYWSSACPKCALKAKCTTGTNRRVHRWEHEQVLDDMQARLDRQPEVMRIRRQTVEHPFGTLKYWMGATHFLTKTLPRVGTEMSLLVLAYNLKRVMHILGLPQLMQVLMVKAA